MSSSALRPILQPSTAVPPVLQHGQPLRGLASTALSQQFEGRFGRLFRNLPAGRYGATDAENRENLKKLGSAMSSKPDAPKDGNDPEESGIPALYTYFGQFIDHDLTFDPMSTLIKQSDPDALTDFRSPAFDMDNVYGRGPNDQPYMYDGNGKFLLGEALDNGAPDLRRNGASPSRAIIGDPRNDENSIISQLQGLVLRFHNRLVDEDKSRDFASIQKIVRFHYQWIVLHDFLPRIVNPKVLERFKEGGQYSREKLTLFHWKNWPFMPVEFSVAAYRLGHSMVRPGYRLNDDDKTLLPIFPPDQSSQGLTGFQAMAKDRGIDWARFIDTEIRSYGTDDASNKERLQFAYRIDTSLVNPLSNLPPSVASDPPPSLAERNLLRGYELRLPTGQAVARAMGITPLSNDQITIGKAVDKPDQNPDDPDVRGTIASIPDLAPFRDNCPLWTYILAEAFLNKVDVTIPVTENKTITTPTLGPVGGRIVSEVFLGLMFGDKNSFLNLDPTWHPKSGVDFRLKHFVDYALGNGEALL